MSKTSTRRQKIALQARYEFREALKGLSAIGILMFLMMIGNSLTDCWR